MDRSSYSSFVVVFVVIVVVSAVLSHYMRKRRLQRLLALRRAAEAEGRNRNSGSMRVFMDDGNIVRRPQEAVVRSYRATEQPTAGVYGSQGYVSPAQTSQAYCGAGTHMSPDAGDGSAANGAWATSPAPGMWSNAGAFPNGAAPASGATEHAAAAPPVNHEENLSQYAKTYDVKSDPEAVCSICLEPLKANETSRLYVPLNCGHVYHFNCISTWFARKGTQAECPYCKEPVVLVS
mmetsp:Transcript_11105/g.34054  ORF Transcript_11105/g.34054 Transcript_11105/m.34054 type:complete len:235 (+) Transcript_11105:107-811(+)